MSLKTRFLVHIVNPVSGWVVTQVHVIEKDADTAVKSALENFGVSPDEIGQTLKAIPQAIGTVIDNEEQTAVQVAVSEGTKAAEPVLTEAEQAAAKLMASLPADVLAILKGE
jgi:division protein CdvB (Snf7/Vps24/ESCRT-III family)